MTDNNPAPQDRKTSYIAPLVIAVAILAVFGFFFLRQPPSPAPAPVPVAKPVPQQAETRVPAPVAPALPPMLTRADLLGAARNAAAAFAEQKQLDGASDALIGRRFSLRIPFGCGDSQDALAQASLSVDAARKSVTLTARPGLWTTLPLFQSLAGDALDAIEGFWIPRPWANAETCPPQLAYAVPATPTPPSARTYGLAQIFTSSQSRVAQHADRPYEFTRKIPANDTMLLSHSYRLLLEGTISGYGDGHALRCWMESPAHHPICLYAVTFDHVAFEDGTTGAVLASWND